MSNSSCWTVGEVAKLIDGQISPALSPDTPIRDFHIRAWSCRKGSVFVPLKYLSYLPGGNKMVQPALKKGAVAALVESTEGLPDGLPLIQVADMDDAAMKLARVSRERFQGTVFGITGTAGKTSVKTMLGHVLAAHGETWRTHSNQNLTPHVIASLSGLKPDLDYAVMEIALLEENTIRDSAQLARPNIAVITSIGLNHAESFSDPHTGILKAKADLIRGLEPGGVAVLPRFSPRYDELVAETRSHSEDIRIVTCGEDATDDVQLVNLRREAERRYITIRAGSEEIEVVVPYIGDHMAENTVMVAGALYAAGLPLSLMRNVESAPQTHSAILRYKLVYKSKMIELIDDSYNTGPLAVQAVTKTAARRQDKRKLLLMCDIGGLEEKRDEVHAELIPFIEEGGFHHVFTVGPATKQMAKSLKTPSSSFGNRFMATRAMQEMLEDGDLVFIKGTAAMRFKDVIAHIKKSATYMKSVGADWDGQ